MRAGRQGGFTLIAVLLVVAAAGAGLAAFGQLASHQAQREKEAQLLSIGHEFEQAIASYYKKERRYPKALDELLKDPRYPMPVRHLRKIYRDPMTGQADWGLVQAPEGGIMGVHSRSEQAPLKSVKFPEAAKHADWRFVYEAAAEPAAPAK